MDEIIFLTLEQVIEIQADQIARYGDHFLEDPVFFLSPFIRPVFTF